MKALVYTNKEELTYKDFNNPVLVNGESIIKRKILAEISKQRLICLYFKKTINQVN